MIHSVKIQKTHENDEFIILVEWYVEEGDFVEAGTPLCCIETSKTTYELEAEVKGYIKGLKHEEGDALEVNDTLCFIVDSPEVEIPASLNIQDIQDGSSREEISTNREFGDSQFGTEDKQIMATKEAKKVALQNKVDLAKIKKRGVIRTKDILEFLTTQNTQLPRTENNQDFKSYDSLAEADKDKKFEDLAHSHTILGKNETNAEYEKPKKIVVYGAGDHGIIAKDLIDASPNHEFVGFLDQKKPKGKIVSDGLILGGKSYMQRLKEDGVDEIFVTVFDRHLREELNQEGIEYGLKLPTIIHPTAIIGSHVMIQEGCFIKAGAVIDSYSVIAEGTIIDNGCVVAHHNRIGRYCHLTPGVVTGGHVGIGDYTLVAIGAKIMSRIVIGEDCWVDIGSVVKKSFSGKELFLSGYPAKILVQGKIRKI
jgi:sugar O-acyltransferase (sialic acid O-acetyltransferase NeuD family)